MIEITTAVIVAVIIGVTQVVKNAVKLPSDYVPVLALVLGIAAFGALEGFTTSNVLIGAVLGLTASGSYDLGKPVVRKVKSFVN